MLSWFRHEQQSIRMAQATVLHHSYDRVHTEYGAPRSQNTATRARGGGGSYEMKYTAKFPKTPPPQAFFQLYDEEDAERGVLRAALLEPRPQGPVQRHTAQHIVDILLCRRWVASWWISCRITTRRHLTSRLSP